MTIFLRTRREILQFGLAAAASTQCRTSASKATARTEASTSVLAHVDHVLCGVPNLEEGMTYIQERSGTKPVVGGVHPGRGTWNALVSLGDRQ